MQISQKGLDLIKEFEGLRLEAYKCSAGVATVGWGHTGPDVKLGMKITEDQAEALLKQDLAKFERGVLEALGDAPTTENQFSALVSLAYNIGLGAFRKSTALREHKAGNSKRAVAGIMMWVKANNKILGGLVRRRRAEAALYASP